MALSRHPSLAPTETDRVVGAQAASRRAGRPVASKGVRAGGARARGWRTVVTRLRAQQAAVFLALTSGACGGSVVFDEETDETGGEGGNGTAETTGSTPASSGATTSPAATTATTTSASTSTGGVAQEASIRVAHLSPGTPAVDFCVLPPDGGAAIGPVLAGAGDLDGLTYSEVTGYVVLPAATYGVRLVPPSADCAVSIAGLPDVAGVTLAAGGAYTAAATGVLVDPGPGDARFSVALFEDDLAADPANVRLRFIHASPDTPPVDVGLGSGATFSPVWTNVPFGSIGLVGGAPYVAVAPLVQAQLSARASGSSADALILDGVTLPAGAIVTVFAIGNLDASPAPLKALACIDGQGACLILPP